MYVACMRQPGHAEAGSRWYRAFQTKEVLRWVRGEFDDPASTCRFAGYTAPAIR